MKKILLIIKREYLTRVRSRTFIISTFLTPLFFVGLIAAVTYFTANSPDKSAAIADNIIEKGPIPDKDRLGISYLAGYISSFLIYITILIYGTMVMRGVSEEKTSRIAEIIISSVKPFQLMMGKILGIGAVGLTQFIMWLILIVIFSSVFFLAFPAPTFNDAAVADAQTKAPELMTALATVNIPLMIGCFVFYFIFGYLFYASLFAAVGSAVSDDAQDTQSLMFPVTMPIVLAIVIMMQAINEPTGSLAVWSSIVPFFAPVVMMARLPFGVPEVVPYWQLILSMLMMVGGFLFITWLSAKIYRAGILLYGKKVSWKEIWKWTVKS